MKITNDIFLDGNLIKNSTIKVRYRGKFTVEFSNQVYIIYGYGLGWKNIQEKKMTWQDDAFVAEINLVDSGELNFCFKNDFGNWDNNNGNDYSVLIEPNNETVKTKEETKAESKAEPQVIESIFKEEPKEEKVEKKDIYRRHHVPEKKTEATKKSKLIDNEESLFEYVNNLKNYEDKYSVINSLIEENNFLKKNTISQKENIGKDDTKDTKVKGKKSKEKKKKTKKSKLVNLIRIFCLLILLFCVIYYMINLSKIKNVQNENKGLLNVEIDEASLKEGKNRVTERMLQVQELNEKYPELKAWIEIEDTVINYPVMQRNDNSFYINHDYKKEYSKWGALFLDKDFDWSIPSSNLLIYGHNFSDGLMFADLLKYRDEEFYNNHKKIRFTTIEEDVEYDILAIFNSRVYYKSEQNVFRYYFFVDAETEEEFDEYVNNAKKASIYKTDIDAEYGDQLLTLSTCDYSQEDGRFVVVARKIND